MAYGYGNPYPGINPNPYYNPGYQTPQQRIQAYEQQHMQQVQQMGSQPPSSPGIIWVQGAEGAKSYMLPPNSTALLMDSEGTRFYIKSTDMSGMPSMRTFVFQEVVNNPSGLSPAPSKPEVSREEFDALKDKVGQYESLLSMLTAPGPSTEVNTNEKSAS